MKLKSINPYSLKTIKEFDTYSDQKVSQIIDATHQGFLKNRVRSIEERQAMMHKVVAILENSKQDCATLMTNEMGKITAEALAEIDKCIWVCKYYANNTTDFLKPLIKESVYKKSYVSYQPLGVILGVMPWNFPFWQVFRFLVPTLMAGNSAILKHASNVSACALLIEKIFKEAGWGDTMYTLLINTSEVKKIIAHEKIKATSLTGSEYAGSQVAMISGIHIKKSVLELGGSDPFVVCGDASIAEAVKQGIASRFLNAGQSCIGAKRFIIFDTIYDEFKAAFKKELSKIVCGDPENSATNLAPLAGVSHADALAKQLAEATSKGATLVQGKRINSTTFSPGFLEGLGTHNPIRQQELFGPIAQFYKVTNKEECVKLCNETPFGLASSVWTNNEILQTYFIEHIEAGAVFINSMVKSDPRLPFGGIKKSGFGRELAEEGIKEFVNVKTIVID